MYFCVNCVVLCLIVLLYAFFVLIVLFYVLFVLILLL